MVIGFDAYKAYNNDALRNYCRYVINNLSTIYSENKYRLYTPTIAFRDCIEGIGMRDDIAFVPPSKVIDKVLPALWQRQTVVRELLRDGVQLYHGLCNELPRGLRKKGIRSVVTIHNHRFFHHPEHYPASECRRFIRKMQQTCMAADYVVAVSDYMRRYAISHLKVDHDKISTIYQGCDSIFLGVASDEEKERVRRDYSLPQKFILNVGTIEPCNNLLSALKALLHLDESIHLVAVGRETPYIAEVKQFAADNSLSARLHIRSHVAFYDLPTVYQLAAVFVYPSSCDCFGVPVVEALCAGVPVVTAGGLSLSEAGGEAVVYINYSDEHSIAQAIIQILAVNRKARRQISLRGKKHAARFDNNFLAWQMISAYNKAMNQ
ncbi:MAG: glycosyltransferase family 4 protein [Tannerellaceae bacterium]|jgi:glycosyltransferase involved in cell wall biosynthesis|nr:glycosyltransferase family 4 protein [Tannerellaceae bacterium]